MLFDQLFPHASSGDRVRTDRSVIEKTAPASCILCRTLTSWQDIKFKLSVCSEECQEKVWKEYETAAAQECFNIHLQVYKEQILEEMECLNAAEDRSKDLLIVVHDQLSYLKDCVESIKATTKNYHLYIWDNNSQQATQDYLKALAAEESVTVVRSETNQGFIEPNNALAPLGKGDYIILINSDTKVFEGWDKAMLGYMQKYPEVIQTGYLGGVLDAEGKGYKAGFGSDIDYVSGWCSCFSRDTYNRYGLFDTNLQFAYCEDADFSIRLQTAGHKIYGLHLMLVHHFENKTIKTVKDEGEVDVVASFAKNHAYLRQKWAGYLAAQRVDVRSKDSSLQERKLPLQ